VANPSELKERVYRAPEHKVCDDQALLTGPASNLPDDKIVEVNPDLERTFARILLILAVL
jgi:hypothetical protein